MTTIEQTVFGETLGELVRNLMDLAETEPGWDAVGSVKKIKRRRGGNLYVQKVSRPLGHGRTE